MSTHYKLIYFNNRALAETPRFIFAYTGTVYEDERFKLENWGDAKAKYEWGTLPVLEIDGKRLGQSQSILRYLGKKFNLAGENDFESAKCDELVETMADFRAACLKNLLETDEEKKNETLIKLKSETFPKFLGKWNEILTKNNGFFVGNKFSYADFCIASYLQIFNESFNFFDKYSALQSHQDTVFNAPGIKEWVAKRPKTKW